MSQCLSALYYEAGDNIHNKIMKELYTIGKMSVNASILDYNQERCTKTNL